MLIAAVACVRALWAVMKGSKPMNACVLVHHCSAAMHATDQVLQSTGMVIAVNGTDRQAERWSGGKIVDLERAMVVGVAYDLHGTCQHLISSCILHVPVAHAAVLSGSAGTMA